MPHRVEPLLTKKENLGTANWPSCWLLLAMLLALEISGFSSTYPRIIWVVVILSLFIVVTGFVERLVQFTICSVSHA